VHLAIGLAGLELWRRLDTAKTYGWLLAAGYGLAFIYGLFAAGNSASCPSTAPTTACTWSAPPPAWPSPCGRPTGPSRSGWCRRPQYLTRPV
jgi:uncharacterized protein DUF4383